MVTALTGWFGISENWYSLGGEERWYYLQANFVSAGMMPLLMICAAMHPSYELAVKVSLLEHVCPLTMCSTSRFITQEIPNALN